MASSLYSSFPDIRPLWQENLEQVEENGQTGVVKRGLENPAERQSLRGFGRFCRSLRVAV